MSQPRIREDKQLSHGRARISAGRQVPESELPDTNTHLPLSVVSMSKLFLPTGLGHEVKDCVSTSNMVKIRKVKNKCKNMRGKNGTNSMANL